MGEQTAKAPGLNRAKTYQLVLFPLNNGATNVYYVLVLSYIATFGSKVLALSMIFASVMVTGMRLFDAITDPIIGALMDRTNGKFGKFRPFMVVGNLIMAASILVLYCLTPLIPASSMFLRYAAFVALYAVWVIGYTFQTSCTRSGQTVLTNDPKQRPLFTIFNTVGSLLGMGAMQFFAPILAKNYEGGYASAGFFRTLAPVGIVISILLTHAYKNYFFFYLFYFKCFCHSILRYCFLWSLLLCRCLRLFRCLCIFHCLRILCHGFLCILHRRCLFHTVFQENIFTLRTRIIRINLYILLYHVPCRIKIGCIFITNDEILHQFSSVCHIFHSNTLL